MPEEGKDKQPINSEQPSESSQEDLASEWEKMLEKEEQETPKEEEREVSTSKPEGETPEHTSESEKIKLFLDIPVEISVEIGNAKLSLEEVLELHPSSVIELERFIDEPVDIKVNGKLVAKGELYMVKENYGIKIKQIITPEERVKLIEED